MKEILTFIAELFKVFFLGLWYLICEFFRIVKIPLMILTVLTVTGIFTRSLNLKEALFFFGFSFIGIVFPSMPVWVYGKKLIDNIYIMAKGKKYIGTCTKFRQGNRAQSASVLMEWADDQNRLHWQGFEAIGIKFIYRHPVTVYSLDNDQEMTNLGVFSIIIVLVYFMIFFILWIICIACTIGWINEICRYLI